MAGSARIPALPAALCLAAAALFGASTPASKLLLGQVDPVVLAGLLYLGAALAMLPLALRGPLSARHVDRANLARLGGAVLFGGAIGPVALLYGLSIAPSASVSLWLNLETAATAVLGVWLFKEHLGPRGWLGVAGVVAAGLMLAAPDGFALGRAGALVAFAAICWGLDNNLTALVDGFTPEQTTLAKGAVAGAVNLGIGLVRGGALPDAGGLIAALGLGALAYGVSIALYVRGAQHLGATRSQLLFSTAPFLGVALAWTWLGEPVLGVQVGAAALMAGAIAVTATARHAHAHTHPPVVHVHLHRHDDGHHDHAHEGLPAGAWHVHAHTHGAVVHTHPHVSDLHHRHDHVDP